MNRRTSPRYSEPRVSVAGDAGSDDVFVWTGQADSVFRGVPGRDLAWLDGLTVEHLRRGLVLAEAGTKMRLDGNGIVSFRDADGLPVQAAGTLTLAGRTLHFSGVARFAFLW